MGSVFLREYGDSVVVKFPGDHFSTSFFFPKSGGIYVNGRLESKEKASVLFSMESRMTIESLFHVARSSGNMKAAEEIVSNLCAFDHAYNKINKSEKSDDCKDSVLFESYRHY